MTTRKRQPAPPAHAPLVSADLAKRLALSFGVLSLGLVVALSVAVRRASHANLPLQTALADPQVKRAVVDQLIAQSPGVFDSFPDPMVGRVLQPAMTDRVVTGGVLSSNEWGMRERSYALPKPAGTIRIVLLGDSYVYGPGMAPDQRCGGFLERAVRERAGAGEPPIECLHLGIPSWNILAECAFVRRQLALLQPDVVLHVVVPNDLDDVTGVRGFGVMAGASPQRSARAGTVLSRDFPATALGISAENYLVSGVDHESRSRYAEAADAIAALASAVEAQGGRYVLVLNWMKMLPVGVDRLTRGLRPEQWTMLPFALYEDMSMRLSPTDGHWNQAGHEAVAEYMFQIIHDRGLLRGIELAEWEQARELASRWTAAAEQELQERRRALAGPDRPRMQSEILTGSLDPRSASQIYTGLFPVGSGPYVSVVLATRGGARLRISGRFLPDAALAHATVAVWVEEVLLQRVPYRCGDPFEVDQALPDSLANREFLNVRLECDDYVYGGADLRTPLSLRVQRIALERTSAPKASS